MISESEVIFYTQSSSNLIINKIYYRYIYIWEYIGNHIKTKFNNNLFKSTHYILFCQLYANLSILRIAFLWVLVLYYYLDALVQLFQLLERILENTSYNYI